MPIVSALLSFLSKRLSGLLQAIFGWSITGLFGRLPSNKQTALSVALVLSIAWPLLVVGIPLPAVAAWALSFVPLEKWIGTTPLRIMWLALAVLVPIAVGAITRWVAPSRKAKGSVVRTLLAGYPITIGFMSAFFITLFVVPLLKLSALRKGWTDEHVYLQVREGKYHETLAALAVACSEAGFPVEDHPLPRMMNLSTRVLKKLASGAIDPIISTEPRMLHRDGLEVYLYPADLLLRGKKEMTARVRAQIARAPLNQFAHLVADESGQKIEDEIERLWELLDHHRRIGHGAHVGAAAGARLRDISAELDGARLPFEQWILLYTSLHRFERALVGGPGLVDSKPTVTEATEVIMEPIRQGHDATMKELVTAALDESRELVKLEVALAKEELRGHVAAAKKAGISLGAALVLGIAGVALLLVAVAMAISPGGWLSALLVGVVALAAAGMAGLLGYKALPTRPLAATRERAITDLHMLKERTA